MKHIISFFLFLFFLGDLHSQTGMPQVNLPNHQQKWRSYFDPLDQAFNIWSSSATNKNEVFLMGELQGTSNSFHLVTIGAFQTTTIINPFGAQTTPIIIKFDSLGAKQWGTFFGKGLLCRGIATDAAGNVYIGGSYLGSTPPQSYVPVTPGAFKTQELPFSVTVGSQTFTSFRGDAYLAKFSSTGTLLWCTLYGGQGGELLDNIVVDKEYNVYIAGSTSSGTDISTPGSFKENFVASVSGGGNNIGMLVKFDSAGHRLWGTYYGGDNTTNTNLLQIATDSSGNIIIAGTTNSHIGIATTGTHLVDYSTSGSQDRLFVAKFDPRGTRLWGTYYGPSQPVNNGAKIILGGLLTKADDIYFMGSTNMTGEIASSGSFMEQNAGGDDAFAVRLNPNGTRKWGSYFGGSGADAVSYNCMRLAKNKKAFYFMGRTNSSSGLSTNNAYNQGETISNPYILKIDLDGNRIWGSYISVHTNLNNLSDPPVTGISSIALTTTDDDGLYTLIRQPKQGCFPLGTSNVFQDTAGGTNTTFLFTKYLDTVALPVIVIPPSIPAIPISFEVYPNPSNGQFTIRTTSTQPYDYIIYAADGKQIKANSTTGYYTSVNIATASVGLYIVKATDSNSGQVYYRKIVKR